MTVKQQILDKLYEVEQLLLEAECDGEQLAELECYSDVEGALSKLVETVDYYLDA